MKKICLVLMVLCASFAQAQVKDYTFTKESGLLTFLDDMQGISITNHTVLDDEVTPSKISIPFSFRFNGVLQDSLGIGENGFIWFGPEGDGMMRNVFTPISDNHRQNVKGIVSALGMDLHPHINTNLTTTIKTAVIGVAPMREMVIEWRNTSSFGATIDTLGEDTMSFQIKLYEFMNRIEIVYGEFKMNPNTIDVAQVGLRGNTSSDFSNRMTSATNHWSNSVAGIDNTSGCEVSENMYPSFGDLFVWTKDNQPPTGINKPVKGVQAQVYPSPSNGVLFVEVDNNEANTITITNIAGQQVLQTNIVGKVKLEMDNHANGLYFYHITTSGGQTIANGKFMIAQ
jgi:hypothetical protein